MTRRVNLDQWNDRTEPPVIVWAYTGVWELEPIAVNDSHDSDLYAEYAAAFLASGYYQTREQVEADHADEYTPEEIQELYSTDRAARAGLPAEWYIEGAAEDGSDMIIYVDEETSYSTRRESWEDALPYLDPESVNEIWQEIAAAREDR